MSWRRKKRLPISGVSLFYIICGCALVLGNMYIMHSGFIQIFDDPQSTYNGRGLQQVSSSLSHADIAETLKDIPALALPDSLRAMHSSASQITFNEAKLRRLMEKDTQGSRPFTEPNQIYEGHLRTESAHNFLANNSKERLTKGWKEHHAILSVSDSDLRAVLNRTSNCAKLQSLGPKEYIASGWTKAVYKAEIGGRPVALKTVDLSGHDMFKCGQQLAGSSPAVCYKRASQKILKELLLLQALHIPNAIRVIEYCVPTADYDGTTSTEVSMAVELGETLDIIKLLQMSWEDRLRISLGVTQLVASLAQSPLGAVAINDFRRQQFVSVDGEIKLSDVDDMSFEEPRCETDAHCEHFFSSANFTLKTRCKAGRCSGYNEHKNIFNAARHFITFLLPHGVPASLKDDVNVITSAYSNATMTSKQLLERVHDVINTYTSGKYLQRDANTMTTKYKKYASSDLPGMFDYRCRYSVASGMCTVSVFDQLEAEHLCNNDPDCRAFVLSPQRTWTGRIIAHLKNNFTHPVKNLKTDLYVKVPST